MPWAPTMASCWQILIDLPDSRHMLKSGDSPTNDTYIFTAAMCYFLFLLWSQLIWSLYFPSPPVPLRAIGMHGWMFRARCWQYSRERCQRPWASHLSKMQRLPVAQCGINDTLLGNDISALKGIIAWKFMRNLKRLKEIPSEHLTLFLQVPLKAGSVPPITTSN